MTDLMQQLIKLRNEDETAWLKTNKEIMEHFFQSSPQGVKDILYDEFNRLAKEIGESVAREKQCT